MPSSPPLHSSGRTSPLLSRDHSYQSLDHVSPSRPIKSLDSSDDGLDEDDDEDEGDGDDRKGLQEKEEEEEGLLGERMVGKESGSAGTYPPTLRSTSTPKPHTSTLTSTRNLIKPLLAETLPSLCLSLVGGVLTGELLERMQTWKVFVRVEELYILVPILMNLKGNLEMNLAARMSTSANIGELDMRTTRRALILGNLFLLQVQALLVSLLASLLSFLLGLLSRNSLPSLSHLPLAPAQAGNPASEEATGSA